MRSVAIVLVGFVSAACEMPSAESSEGGGGSTGQDLAACTIDGVDYPAGAPNSAVDCLVCAPANPSVWTTDPSSCLIDGRCYAAGERDSDLGCMACVPASSQTAWSRATSCPSDDVDRCPDGFPRGTAGDVRLVQEISPALEGVAVCPNGDVFVSQPETAQIFRVPLDGSPPELWTILPGHQPLGMDCASDNVLYVADFGSDGATVFRIAAKNDPGTPLPKVPGDNGYGAMNGIAIVEGVGIYATDRTNTLIGRIILFTEVSPNVFEASVAKGGLPFPNDVAFHRSTGMLDVTMTVNSQVLSYPVAPDGALGDHDVTWAGTLALDAVDGLAVTESNDRYIAHYLQGNVSRSSDGQTVASVTEPRSLAFRGGTLFVTARTGLYAVDLAVCGAPR